MSESGRACPAPHYHFPNTKSFSLGGTRRGTNREDGRWETHAGVDMFPVCSTPSSLLFSSLLLSVCVLLAAERQLGSRQKRSGLHFCFLRSLLLCIAVAASFRVMKQASTLLFSLSHLFIYLFTYLIIFSSQRAPRNEPWPRRGWEQRQADTADTSAGLNGPAENQWAPSLCQCYLTVSQAARANQIGSGLCKELCKFRL